MKKELIAAMMAVALGAAVAPVLAGDEELCLDCHEPAEDWEGMSAQEVFTEARAPGNKRHKDNDALSDEQLKAIIATLVPQ